MGFAPSTASTMPASSPCVPPMKACVGAGRLASASGARPSTQHTLLAPSLSALRATSPMRSGLSSMAKTLPARAASAHSTLTDPVPAPMSHTRESACRRSLHTAAWRTSSLVMGASPRSKSSSRSPGACQARTMGEGFSMSMHARSPNVSSATSAAVPPTMRSWSMPRRSPTCTRSPPRPCSASERHTSWARVAPPVRAKVRAWLRAAPATSHMRPCAESTCASCQGIWSREQSSCSEETPGCSRTSTPAMPSSRARRGVARL